MSEQHEPMDLRDEYDRIRLERERVRLEMDKLRLEERKIEVNNAKIAAMGLNMNTSTTIEATT